MLPQIQVNKVNLYNQERAEEVYISVNYNPKKLTSNEKEQVFLSRKFANELMRGRFYHFPRETMDIPVRIIKAKSTFLAEEN